jgi:hypothetical protein
MASWHVTRNLTVFYNVLESNQLPMEISNGMLVSHINSLVTCSLVVRIL